MAYLGTRRATELDLYIPPTGGWLAQVTLDSGAPPAAGRTTLTVADLALVGTILPDRGGLDAPDRPTVVVAGGAGWLLPLARGAYESANGVRLSTVLADLARVAGEPYDAPAEASLGASYGWEASTDRRPARAANILADLVERGAVPAWRVTPSGRASFTPWPALPAADARGVIEDRALARGARHVALDASAAAWLPGATVQGATITRVQFVERDGELRAVVWS